MARALPALLCSVILLIVAENLRGGHSDIACFVCHSPGSPANRFERARRAGAGSAAVDRRAPAGLWENAVGVETTYILYNARNRVTYGNNYVGPDVVSKLCLSCHDGTVASDGGMGGRNRTHGFSVSRSIGESGDLTNDHPVGVRYPGLSADGRFWTPQVEWNDPTSPTFSADGIDGAAGVQLIRLPDGSKGVGCTSCHHPHNNRLGYFRRTSMRYSFLCLKCHDL